MLMTLGAMAQNDLDAFRFSQVNWSGTARFMGAGGAFGSIGGDFSSLATNPAGIGLFKKDEISFTPIVINAIGTNAVYNGESVDANSVRYSLTNFGSIFSWTLERSKPEEERKWRMMQFGFGYNRINDFNNLVYASGMSGGTTMIDGFVNASNGIPLSALYPEDHSQSVFPDGELAWGTWLMDTVAGTDDQYENFIGHHNMRQNSYTKTTGGIDEMNFSLGANYNDQLYLGLTLGVPFLNYKAETEYSEVDENDAVGGFNEWTSYETLRTSGTGINAKFGLIYQPVDFMRIGVAIHTPTYYGNLKENYTRQIKSDFDSDDFDEDYENLSKYKLTTPFRVMGSLGFLIAKRAFISAEYEFTDYSMARLASSENILYRYDYAKENNNVKLKYGACHTIRVGGELTVTEHFLVRLGYSYSSSPFKNKINTGSAHNISGGIGFRGRVFFADLAYVCRLTGQNSWFFEDPTLNPVEISNINHKFAATIGVKF